MCLSNGSLALMCLQNLQNLPYTCLTQLISIQPDGYLYPDLVKPIPRDQVWVFTGSGSG